MAPLKRRDSGDTWAIYNRKATDHFGSNKITFKQATEAGLMFYAGSECLNCGSVYRYTATRRCRRCVLQANKRNTHLAEHLELDEAREVSKRTTAKLYSLEDARIERELRGY